MIDVNGRWYPNISPKQLEVFNDTHTRVLLSGPRACGKTIVAIHKAIKHAWQFDNDRVGLFVKSTKIGKTGIWDDLITYALPEWEEGLREEGFKIKQVGQDGATRMMYCRIANQHGGESEIQLHPLHFQDSVHEKLKGSRFGFLLFDEVDNYDNPEVYNVSAMQLRQIGMAEDKMIWLGTCNPAGDESHWLYQKFWIEPKDPETAPEVASQFKTFEFGLVDNPYLDPRKIAELKQLYKNDPDMFARYVEGKWTADYRNAHFAGAFRHMHHVIGNVSTYETIVPTDKCAEILVGWDLGDRNNSVVFLEHVLGPKTDYWTILDDVSRVEEDLSLQEIVEEVMRKMAELNALAGGKVVFKHWSDRSAFDRYRSAADARDHILVNQYSEGAITLIGCPKPPNSVAARISLVRQLLIGNRLFVSAHCNGMVEMFKKLAKGKTKGEPIKRDNRYIHRFDAMSYAVYGESIDEIEDNLRPKTSARVSDGFSIAR